MAINFENIDQKVYDKAFLKEFVKPIQIIMNEYHARPAVYDVTLSSELAEITNIPFKSLDPNVNINVNVIAPNSMSDEYVKIEIEEQLIDNSTIKNYFVFSKNNHVYNSVWEETSFHFAFTSLRKNANGKITKVSVGPKSKSTQFDGIEPEIHSSIFSGVDWPFGSIYYGEETLDAYAQIEGKNIDEELFVKDMGVGTVRFPDYMSYDDFDIVDSKSLDKLLSTVRYKMGNNELNIKRGR